MRRARRLAWVGVGAGIAGVVFSLWTGHAWAAACAAYGAAGWQLLAWTVRGWEVDRGLIDWAVREAGNRD